MKPIIEDNNRKQNLSHKPGALDSSLERAIRRARLIDWLVDVSIYIHWLDSTKRARADNTDNTPEI